MDLKESDAELCFICQKKLKIMKSFTCKCGNNYCDIHKFPEDHKCSYDYKKLGKKIIEENNPLIKVDQLKY